MSSTTKPLDLAAFEGHTPGPWRVVINGAVFVNGPDGTKDAHSIAKLYALSRRDNDARLLAAAPLLLAECKRQREEIATLAESLRALLAHSALVNDAFYVRGTPKAMREVMGYQKAILQQARAALAATGKGGA